MKRKVTVCRFMFAVALCITTLSSALADVRILASPGGKVGNYLNFFSQVRRSGERVIIDGPCMSACTLVLSTIPRNRILRYLEGGPRVPCTPDR